MGSALNHIVRPSHFNNTFINKTRLPVLFVAIISVCFVGWSCSEMADEAIFNTSLAAVGVDWWCLSPRAG